MVNDDATWIKFRKIDESTGVETIRSGILHGMTATKCAIETMSGIQMVDNNDVVDGWYF